MKKILVILLVLTAFTFEAQAQEISKNAIGLRLGDSDGFGTEINYQRAVGTNNNRLEFGLGWRSNNDFDAYKLVGLYQWVWNIDGGFNWYAGPGAGIAQVDFDDRFFPNDDRFDDTETYIFLAGDVGIEYNFDFPLLLSLDFRPEFGFGDYNDDVDFDIALGVRYQF
ncbi:hypothetical protein [Cochleicola gelatinilyticus]|uniref:Outer membrane protein beta-barrel domain-containing protein n=1 Tax=Cochleicola gelatinilyticus TaxID=1763537 RepID=A0A167GVL1_9FLAO|nr:hypothetical protein [Cochleicola gelatinilyticus]OAB77948.1 hypothetical protein ULVI_10685 [Cochleicola gelatinilyticus]